MVLLSLTFAISLTLVSSNTPFQSVHFFLPAANGNTIWNEKVRSASLSPFQTLAGQAQMGFVRGPLPAPSLTEG